MPSAHNAPPPPTAPKKKSARRAKKPKPSAGTKKAARAALRAGPDLAKTRPRAKEKEKEKQKEKQKASKALVVPRSDAQAALTKEERLRLAEAIRLGEEARRNAEDALTAYGRWLLVNVFGDDTSEALTNKRANPVWHALIELAGGPKLRLSRTSLHLAVQIAAYDKRLGDETFRALDVTRKRLLLPLAEDSRIRDAAQHVVAMKLTAADTQAYVRSLLTNDGGPALLRMTPTSASARIARAAKPFKDRSLFGKWKSQLALLSGDARRDALSELRAITKAVDELMSALEA